MKKTLIASAVAAATLSSTAFAMDPATQLAERLDSMPEFYGNIQLAWANMETDNGTTETSTNEFMDNGSTFGIKHDHAISEDVTGFLKAEFHFDGDDNSTDSGLGENMDEAYIGIKGDFGSVQLGSDDTVYEWVDVMDMYEFNGLEGDLATQKEGDNLQYYSPELAGGLTLGVTLPIDSDSTFGGALAAKYAMDNIEVVLAYGMGREEGGAEAGDAIGLAGTIGLDELTLSLQYETKDESTSGADDGLDYFGIMGQYAMGANNFALGYQMKSFDASGAEDESGIYVQALHNLSDHMYIYLEYLTQSDVDGTADNEVDTLALGATYAF
ncbi:MAG: porin [Oleiphilaceae bacterium]|nr:porin [Oleiphilaceae bacterium]